MTGALFDITLAGGDSPEAVLGGFGGPGGWDEGARILGLTGGILGVELDPLAARTAAAAGHARLVADIAALDPADYAHVTGLILSSPCPTWSESGLRSGWSDMDILLDVITHAGQGCDCSWDDIAAELEACTDVRTALAAQLIRWALALPALEWLAFEQVPAAEYMFEDIAAELVSFDDGTGEGGHGPGFEGVDVFTACASHFGLPVRRERVFLVGRRWSPLGVAGVDDPSMQRHRPFPAPTFAEALGWPAGHQVRTRNGRTGSGGNLFSADGPAWCLTGSTRTWERDADGRRLTTAEAGRVQGFRPDYPWTGSRTRQFHQVGDVVCPPVAAAVLGYATGTPWTEPVRAYLDELFTPGRGVAA